MFNNIVSSCLDEKANSLPRTKTARTWNFVRHHHADMLEGKRIQAQKLKVMLTAMFYNPHESLSLCFRLSFFIEHILHSILI